MRISAISTIVYFTLTLVYKLFADSTEIYHTNLYWLYTSILFCLIAFDMRKNAIIKMYGRIFLSASIYWGIMSLLHIICLFNIDFYKYLNTTNKFTVGAATIIVLSIYLTSTLFSHDTKEQR